MIDDEQMSFDFNVPPKGIKPIEPSVAESKVQYEPETAIAPQSTPEEKKSTTVSKELKPREMKRAILGWLIPQKPSGAALSVPTRVSKYCADVAAFWSSPGKKRLMHPDKTLIVEIRRSREQCWPDCSRQEELLPLLREKKEEKASLETEIRKNEPELRETDTLFPEYESWDYKSSKNKKYQRCLRQLEDIEHALYKGSRFEQIRRAHVADYLYLAVPAGTVLPNELADGWGLININSDMTTEVIKEADTWECPEINKLHLIQHIATSSKKSLLFANGVNELSTGKVSFTPIPKKRRKKSVQP